MLDQKLLERARGIIAPEIHRCRRRLQDEILKIQHEMLARGILQSSMTAQQIARACEAELRVRTDIAWGQLKKVHGLFGSVFYPELAGDFKYEVAIHRKEAFRELSPLIPRLANAYSNRELSLDDADWRVEQEINAEIDLYVDSLEFARSNRVIEGKPIVFISCGQFASNEVLVGESLARLVSERLFPCVGYFAQNVNSLDGLSRNILGALDRCVGFVAIMHKRGEVTTLHSSHVRGSVWVEQELAIAAFLTQVLQRPLAVAAYIQQGIKREGIRDQLILNPMEFETEEQILSDFETSILDRRFAPQLAST